MQDYVIASGCVHRDGTTVRNTRLPERCQFRGKAWYGQPFPVVDEGVLVDVLCVECQLELQSQKKIRTTGASLFLSLIG